MSKISGAPFTTCTIDDSGGTGRDIRNDITNLDWSMPIEFQDSTGLDKVAMERIALLSDFQLTLNGIPNFDTNMSHDVLKDFNTGVARTVVLGIGGASLTNEVLIAGYNISRGNTAEMTWESSASLSDGTLPTWA